MKKILMLTILTLITGTVFAAEVNTNVQATSSVKGKEVRLVAGANVDFKSRIATLRAEKKQLIADVKAGKISKEEAKRLWKDKVAKIREEKKNFFEKRLRKIEERKAKLAEIAPEIATRIGERLNAMKERRKSILEIRAKIQAGDLTREDAREKLKSVRESFRSERKAYWDKFKVERRGIREKFIGRVKEMKDEAKKAREEAKAEFDKIKKDIDPEIKLKLDANKQALIGLKADAKAGKISKKDVRKKFQALRKEQKDMLNTVKGDMKGKREEIFKEAKEKREVLKNEFQKRKEKATAIRKINADFGIKARGQKRDGRVRGDTEINAQGKNNNIGGNAGVGLGF